MPSQTGLGRAVVEAMNPMDPWSEFLRRLLVTASLAGAAPVPPPEAGAATVTIDPAEPAASDDLPDTSSPHG